MCQYGKHCCMPKKTREEKKKAAGHILHVKPLDTQEEQTVTWFKKDLTRSLIIIVLIVTLEFFLYFASINHYFSFGR